MLLFDIFGGNMRCTGHAFMNSGHTDIVTVIVRYETEFETKYKFLSIRDYSSEEEDIKRAINWGSSLPPQLGEDIINTIGSNKIITYKDNINLRRH